MFFAFFLLYFVVDPILADIARACNNECLAEVDLTDGSFSLCEKKRGVGPGGGGKITQKCCDGYIITTPIYRCCQDKAYYGGSTVCSENTNCPCACIEVDGTMCLRSRPLGWTEAPTLAPTLAPVADNTTTTSTNIMIVTTTMMAGSDDDDADASEGGFEVFGTSNTESLLFTGSFLLFVAAMIALGVYCFMSSKSDSKSKSSSKSSHIGSRSGSRGGMYRRPNSRSASSRNMMPPPPGLYNPLQLQQPSYFDAASVYGATPGPPGYSSGPPQLYTDASRYAR